jgi:hypothetical protein
MPDTTLYTFLPPSLNKPVHGLLMSGQTTRTRRIAIIEASVTVHSPFGSQSGYFVTTTRGNRYTLIVLPVSAFHAWLVDFLGIPIPQKEVSTI